MNYLRLIMSRGHSIEYFIEGGRSRTGRLLQPKTGMLSMTLRSYLRDRRRPVTFLPVYFGYERLVEGKTYIGELSGKPKEKESVFGMLRTLPLLRQKFGKVHVSFGEPIRLQEVLDEFAVDPTAQTDEKPEWFSPALDRLAQRIMTNINSAACATPINLIALVLLATPKQAMLESDLYGKPNYMHRSCVRHRTRRGFGLLMRVDIQCSVTPKGWGSCNECVMGWAM